MVEMKFLLALLVASCVLAEGKLLYKHDEKVCSKPNAEKDHPFCNWHYLVYAPRIFKAGTNAKVLVSTNNIDFDVNVTTALMSPNGKVFSSSNNIIKPGGLTQVNLKVPFDIKRSSSWYVRVNGTADVPKGTNGIPEDATWTFSNRTNHKYPAYISFKKSSSHRVLIQTDRPIYKPGETIRIRVLSIDSNFKAVSGVISKVAVLNPSRTTMRQWRNEKLSGGFASFKLKLSIKPVLGLWRVKASVNGKQAIVYINVAKYVLPKFKVSIKPHSYIAYGQTKVDGEICAKYSYGKDVNGQLKAKICATHPRIYSHERGGYNRKRVICEDIVKKISGCTPFEIDLMFFELYKQTVVSYLTPTFTIEASVKESATAITLNATKVTLEVETSLVQLSFEGTPEVFKPGLPFEAWVHAKRPNGDPIDNIIVEVKIRDGRHKQWHRQDIFIRRGKAKVTFSTVLFNAKNVQLVAQYSRKKIAAHGVMNHWRTSDVQHTASAWYSPTHSYISITKQDKVYKPGTDATFNVMYTTTDSQKISRNVFYALMCKGNVAASGSFSTEFLHSPEVTKPESTTTGAPPTTIPMAYPWVWERRPVTRPPLPKGLSVGSFNFSFPVTQDMTPSCRMLVYYIKDRETVADSLVIQTGNSFANKVSMKFSEKQVFPGTKVNLTLKASPGSRFAISAVDKSVHFLRKANDLKAGQVLGLFKELDVGGISFYNRCGSSYWYRRSSDFVDSQKAFDDNGMTFLSNLFIDTRPCNIDLSPIYFNDGERIATATAMPQIFTTGGPRPEFVAQPDAHGPIAKPKAKPKIRSDFPETWLWTEEKFDDKTAEKVVTVTVPDTITTWYASGFAVSDETGLGVANSAEIIGFKEMFVSMNLPYSVIRGEVVTLPIVIFNYMPDCLHAKISMKDTKYFHSLTRSYADICICGGQSATVMFKIIPRKLGRVEIEGQVETLSTNTCPKHVKFDSNSYIDIVRRKLLVEPEGIEKEYTYNSLVCPSEKTPVAGNVKLRIPDKVVPGSVFAELRVIGDLMGPSLSNIDNLLKMPYGCGEQNMLNFAPNIFIMQYLKATGQLTDAIKEKAEGYTLQGYQRELSYKHPDGSYSAFGERDKEGSMWLTAFVLKSFAQARPFIQIDKKVLMEATKWITRKQSRDGCFPTVGSLHSKSMKGGVSSPVTLTGYVVISLLEADIKPNSPSISRAIAGCIKPNLKNVNDSYSVAILAYAMAKAGRTDEYKFLLNKLNSLAVRESEMRHWEEPKAKEEKHSDWFYPPYHQARSADIEMTAYALLAMLPKKDKTEGLAAIDIVRWLSQQRNSLGGWSSTQDTVLAMQALAQYAALVYGGVGDMTIDVSTEGLQHKFAVSNKNSLVLQRVQLPSKFPSVLKTFASGKGCALLAASVKYNVLQVQEVPAFSLSVNISPVKSNSKLSYGRCRSQKMTICAAWLREGESNMAIIAVKMLSGFRPVIPSLDKAVKLDASLKEYEKKGNEWIFYYSKIRDVCINFRVKQANIVEGIKPASVSVYDYYDTDKAATAKYRVTAKMCK